MIDFSIIAVLVLALAVVFVDQYLLEESELVPSIAILPLANVSGDSERDYFVDGMTDALISSLSRIRALRVVSRRSVMRYKNSTLSLGEIAAELGVRAVLEGSAIYEGGRVRIMAQLIDAISDRNLWADSYERDIADVLGLQNDVALDIAREIAVAMTPEEESRLLNAPAVDPETYEAYLRGMYHLNGTSPEDIAMGLAYLHEAVDRDPADALAYAGLAIGYATVGHSIAPPDGVWERAEEAAQRAMTLNPDLAEAHLAMGDVKLYASWDFAGAEASLLRAMELSPSLAMAHYHYAWYLALVGRFDEAIAEHSRARDLDPLTPLHTAWLGTLHAYRGEYEETANWARRALEINAAYPVGHYVLGKAYVGMGMLDEAVATHEAMAAANPEWRGLLGITYAIAGRDEQARNLIAELGGAYADQPLSWISRDLGVMYAVLGEAERSAEWLAREPHHAFVPWIVVDPLVEPVVRDQPAFIALLDELDLPPESCCPPRSMYGWPR